MLRVDGSMIGTLNASIGKAKSKKTFNVAALVLLPNEKELNSQPPVVVPLTVENAFASVFEKFVEAFPKKFGLVLFDLNGIYSYSLV